jgi:hypothetical protein
MATVLTTRNGVLDDADKPAFNALKAAMGGDTVRLLLHLHGGLVDEAAGRGIAQRLSGGTTAGFNIPPGWEQVYVVWRTGALETLQTNWTELFEKDRLYKVLLKRLLEFAAGKVKLPGPGGRSAGATVGLTRDVIAQRLKNPGAGDPFADINEQVLQKGQDGRAAVLVEQSEASLDGEFREFLGEDPEFIAAIEPLDLTLNQKAEGRGGRAPPGPTPAQATAAAAMLKRLNPEVREPVQALAPTGEAGRSGAIGVATFLIKHAARISMRIIRRLRSGRDHGFYATVVEELVRELYGDFIGASVWGFMKQDAADHFGAGGLGRDLLAAIPDHCRVLVTAHSAGAIWATQLIKAVKAEGRGIKLDLVLLAPAVRMDLFAEAVTEGGDAVGRCRIFTMSDPFERQDVLLGEGKGYLYPSSLLYLVSGLFEEVGGAALPDAPILGLERFLAGPKPWLKEEDQIRAVETVVRFFQLPGHDIVYSKTADGAGDGLQTEAISHGAFDAEPKTLASVSTFFA